MNYLKKELYQLIQSDPEIFDFIQDSALDGMWYWDIENMEEEWMNPRFWSTLGYDHSEMPHKSSAWQDIINQDDLQVAFKNAQLHFENPDHKYDQLVRYKHKNGKTIWIRCRGLAIRDENGNPKRMLGAHTDVTSLKEKELELTRILEITKEQNERLKNFAYIVSHNLRSHAGNFEILLNILFEQYPNTIKEDLAEHIKTASKNLKETVYDLNEIVSSNTKFSEKLNIINLTDAINKCVTSLAFTANKSNVKIINSIDNNLKIKGIQAYIDSIIHNFLTNGIKYNDSTKDSYVKISNKIIDNKTALIIEDNGLGIDLNKNGDQLFGMYNTFHNNDDAKGLGLFITKNQIEALGGKIEVESELNKGTTFKVYFTSAPN